ncbi:MAG: FAD-dependent oxidoreductase, partial [Oscillospiraceae bacterium]|nr:FAD-dependent oxidoreductase [Oscillospiraceae bacterium]
DCDTLLLSIGLIPENELSRQAGIAMDRRTNGAVVYENMETSIPGVFACGNVVQVHDLVDYVTGESIRAGKAAAEYVLGSATEEGEVLSLANGDKVGYTVPMKIRKANVKGNVEVFFRVKKVFGKSAIVVTQGDKQIARYKRSYMLPSEMEKIILPKKILDNLSAADGEIRVSAVEEEG